MICSCVCSTVSRAICFVKAVVYGIIAGTGWMMLAPDLRFGGSGLLGDLDVKIGFYGVSENGKRLDFGPRVSAVVAYKHVLYSAYGRIGLKVMVGFGERVFGLSTLDHRTCGVVVCKNLCDHGL